MRYSLALIAVGAGAPDALPAQVTLEVLQGTTWTSKLTIPELQPMAFRWKWTATSAIASATWQLTFLSPSTSSTPVLAASGSAPVPQSGQYSTFQIQPPANAPSTFYARVRTAAGNSAWIPIVVAQRATTTLESPKRQTTTLPPPPPPLTLALADLACDVKIYPGALLAGLAPTVSAYPDNTFIVSGKLPQFTGITTVKNHGFKAATVAVGILTTVNGVNQIGKTQTVTVEAGAQKMLWFGGWDRVVDWKNPGKNDLTARVTTDFYKGTQELNENNNGCGVALYVDLK